MSWDPSQYEKFKSERSAPFYDLLSLIEGRGFSEVVDLGCGTGELTRELHQRLGCGSTLGIDSSESMLANSRVHKESGLTFEEGKIEDFHSDEKWDLIFSNAALQWCSGHPRLLRRFYESLKPGGQLAIQMPANHDYPTHVLAEEIANEEPFHERLGGERRGNPVATPETYAELLFQIKFRDQHVRLQVYPHILGSREDVIEWVKGTLLTYYQTRLGDLYPAFFEVFRARLMEALPNDKPFFYPFKRLHLWARK